MALVIGVGLGDAGPAAAHGDPEFSGDVGPFAVETFDEQITETGLLYTVVVNDPSTGLAVRGAAVEVSAGSATRQVGPLVGNELGGAYQVLLPHPRDEVWLITVRIMTADDSVIFEHELRSGVEGKIIRWRRAIIVASAVMAGAAALALALVARRKGGSRPRRT